jgi:hypothetical protein
MARRFGPILLVAVALAPILHADVKTKEKTTVKFEGFMGRVMGMFGGSAAKDGITSTVALKGNRLARMNDATGEIIDLSEQKVYTLDVKKKEYKVQTFDEIRRQIQEERDKAAKQAKDMPAQDKQNLDSSGKQIQFDADVKETGQHKQIAGYDAREVVLTITAHEKDKKIEDSGGFVLTSDMWMAPHIAALDEVMQFELKYFQAIYGQALGIDPRQLTSMMAMFPSFAKMSEEMKNQGGKLQGTALFTTMTFETVKSAEDMQNASKDQQQTPTSGNGLGSMLARRLAGRSNAQTGPKSLVMTTTAEKLSVETSASADDVAVPAGFKEKK